MVAVTVADRGMAERSVEVTREALEPGAIPAWLECKHLQVFRSPDYSRCLAGCSRHLGRECLFRIGVTASLAVMGAGQTIGAEAGIAVRTGVTIMIATGDIGDGALTGMRRGMSMRIRM